MDAWRPSKKKFISTHRTAWCKDPEDHNTVNPSSSQTVKHPAHKITHLESQTVKRTELCASEIFRPVPVAARSKACVYGRSLAEIVGSNPAESMHVCLLWVLCVVRYRSLHRADPSSRGILPSVCVCVCVCVCVSLSVISAPITLYTYHE